MATPPKKSLGRGLGSLIGGGVVKPAAPAPVTVAAAAPVAPGLQLQELLLTSIVPNPRQPRRDFDDAQVKELADSIRLHAHCGEVFPAAGGTANRLATGRQGQQGGQAEKAKKPFPQKNLREHSAA